ncbi:hypothetical protein ACWD4B_15665 [Streptomyces sp. NPDC002536]
MVALLDLDPLQVRFSFPDGSNWTADLSKTTNPRLAAELASGLVQLVHPLGNVTRRNTAVRYASTLRRMVASLTEAGFQGGVADLRKSHMLPYWLSVAGEKVMMSRMLLKGCGAIVDEELRAYVDGKPVKRRPITKPLEPYSESEWRAIESGLRALVQQMLSDHREAVALAQLGPEDAAPRALSRRTLAWLMYEHGPITRVKAASVLGASPDVFRGWGAEFDAIRDALYPPVFAVHAVRSLFGVYCGVVPDGIRDLGVDDFTWAGDRTVLMNYVKRRRGPESVSLPSRAVRLLDRWMELSAQLRRFTPKESADALWVFRDVKGHESLPEGQLAVLSPLDVPGSGVRPRRRLAMTLGLRTDAGEPLLLHAGRIRTTYHHSLARRGWTGRTTIDPNHTARVEGDHYVSAVTPAQADAVESIIEDAQADVLRRARPPVLLTEEEAAEFVAQQPQAAARLGLDHGAMADLLSGEMDVFTASCANQLAGLHGPAGKPCPARPWVCLLCPLAVFLPRHAPNLLRLKAYFARQSRQMTTEQFLAVFGPYADRLDHDILPRFPASALDQAASEVADTDAELPLRPEEGTQ